ncbi:hypothetical protein [Parasphingorhabdus cellanae]|uniref:Cytochrome c-type biogenesis protein n=1 Tax=Parasphingorhabdus cellanae TaxID=2806553 RepID=A0ABX7T3X2_9SPHN|nr:hypothetical protein [Parasphingorhabdus cellanae]QTD56236.1 hypothetical protein J4G78_01115 [Parasphingorhabdus cellanae]
MAEKAKTGFLEIIRSNIIPVAVAFALFIFLFLLPQSVFYRGLISYLAEWQFTWFGNYLPIFTVILPVLLLTILLILILWLIFRLRNKDNQGEPEISVAEQAKNALGKARLAMFSFFALAAFSLLAVIVTLVLMMTLPNENGKAQKIDVGSLPFTEPEEGRAELNGALDWQKLATIKRNLVFASQRTYFIPIVSQLADRKSTRYFVQVFRPEFVLPRNQMPGRSPEREHLLEQGLITPTKDGPSGLVTGVLRQDGLPEEIVLLYEKAGVEVHPDHYVLYRKTADMHWPYWGSAWAFLLFGIGAFLFGLYQKRQHKRLKDGIDDS